MASLTFVIVMARQLAKAELSLLEEEKLGSVLGKAGLLHLLPAFIREKVVV